MDDVTKPVRLDPFDLLRIDFLALRGRREAHWYCTVSRLRSTQTERGAARMDRKVSSV